MNDESQEYNLRESGYSEIHDFEAVDTGMGENPDVYDYERVDDAVTDENKPEEHDGRAITNTGWNPKDMDTKEEQRRWRWLNTLNDDYRSPESKEQKREADRERDAEAFMTELRCTPHQRERVLYLIDSFDGGSMGGTTKEETLIMAVISLVVDEDDRVDREIRDEDEWDELLFALDIPQWKIGQARNLLGRRDVMSNNQIGGALHV